jgi:predicted DNA-binding transcriptional regulator YafY
LAIKLVKLGGRFPGLHSFFNKVDSVPAKNTRHTLIRQWALLQLLPTRGPGKTAKELTDALNNDGYNISKRQVERDLLELYDAFGLDLNNSSIPYGWRLPPHVPIDLPSITLAEALSLQLVEGTLKALMPSAMMNSLESRFLQAKRKLETLEANNQSAQWLHKVAVVSPSLSMLPPAVDPDVLETVQDALLHNRQLIVEYKKFDAEESSKQSLNPLGLVQRGSVTYLVATAFDYNEVLLYVLHRIITASKTKQPASIPAGFSLENYIAKDALQFGNKGSICLKAEVCEGLAQILSETPLSADQQIEGIEGALQVTATVTDSWQLRWWILSQGDGIEVIEPNTLRNDIARQLQRASEQYH